MKLLFILLISLSVQLVKAEGPVLKFVLDENFLIAHTLTKNSKKLPHYILDFREDLIRLFPSEFESLSSLDEVSPESVSSRAVGNKFEDLFKKGKAHPAYARIFNETNEHLEEVRREWLANIAKTSSFMTELTKINLNQNITVFITHPQVYLGRNFGNNSIGWGRKADWPNYFTVYLWHEVMHSFLLFNSKSHALIELMTDDCLRHYLNGGSYPPFSDDGHQYLIETKSWIFENYWKHFLARKEMSVYQLEMNLLNDTSFPLID